MSYILAQALFFLLFQLAVSLPLNSTSSGNVVAAWYAGWSASYFSLPTATLVKYNTLIYAFAATTQNSISLAASDQLIMPAFVQTAHQNGVAAHIGVGGSNGGDFFSSNVATAESRSAFKLAILGLVKQYSLDGVAFDWEFPGTSGSNPEDTKNFLVFLQELRGDASAANLTLAVATPIKTFYDSSGKPSTDVSGFAKVLDYIVVMNYDVWGPWSATVGPNAPLEDSCAPPGNQLGSAASALEAWTLAGIPASQIVLGVPAYGRTYNVPPSDAFKPNSTTELASYPKFDSCSTVQFQELISDGLLTADGSAAPGIHYRYDNCSQTPYLYDEASERMVSYDNAPSFAAKGSFIQRNNLRGFSMWLSDDDYEDILLDSIKGAI